MQIPEGGGVRLGNYGGDVPLASQKPYPICDQNLWFSLSYNLTKNWIPLFTA